MISTVPSKAPPVFPLLNSLRGQEKLREKSPTKEAMRFVSFTSAIQLISMLGMSVSCYLAWVTFSSGKIAGCGSGEVFDCSSILKSHWSTVFGIPVSVPAVLLYATTFIILFVPKMYERVSKWKWWIVTFLAFSAGLAAAWFIGLQLFLLRHLCPYCLGVHACGLVMAGMVAFRTPAGKEPTRRLAVAAILGVAILIVSQITLAAPETFELIEHQPGNVGLESPSKVDPAKDDIFESPLIERRSPNQTSLSNNLQIELIGLLSPMSWLNFQTSVSTEEGPAATNLKRNAEKISHNRRTVKILKSVTLDVAHWPILGKPDAKYFIVEMFDYTCQHCQITDVAILGAMEKFGDDLAVIVLPAPMNASCNQFVKVTGDQHTESCELAKLAIAVWRLEPNRFGEFHHWLFQSKPTYATALKFANQLVGENLLKSELQSKFPSEYVGKIVELYRRSGAGAIPKIFFPSTTAVGEMSSTQTLISLIDRELIKSN